MFAQVRRRTTPLAAWALIASSLPGAALATNGYFTNGSSVQSNGLGGAGVAFPVDSLAGYINPAGLAFVGSRVDLGLTIFRPDRSAKVRGNGFGADGHYAGNARDYFPMPEAGYTRQVGEDTYFGLSLTANGGMNTGYRRNPYRAFGGRGAAGVNLQQIVLTPALAFRLTPNQSFGVGLNIAWQRFYATGLGAFAGASRAPDKLTNTGYSNAWGAGARVGWTGRFFDQRLSLGATWASRIHSRFDGYRGLFAQHGGFDIPQNASIGAAFKATPALTVLADVQRIFYAQTRSVGHPLAPLLRGLPLGSEHGPGFGWRNINVYKVAASYELAPALTLRAGFSHAQQPVPSSETFFNILAPGVVQNQLSLGATWHQSARGELSFYYSHAFEREVRGHGSIPPNFGGGEANVKLSEDSLGFAYGWRL